MDNFSNPILLFINIRIFSTDLPDRKRPSFQMHAWDVFCWSLGARQSQNSNRRPFLSCRKVFYLGIVWFLRLSNTISNNFTHSYPHFTILLADGAKYIQEWFQLVFCDNVVNQFINTARTVYGWCAVYRYPVILWTQGLLRPAVSFRVVSRRIQFTVVEE